MKRGDKRGLAAFLWLLFIGFAASASAQINVSQSGVLLSGTNTWTESNTFSFTGGSPAAVQLGQHSFLGLGTANVFGFGLNTNQTPDAYTLGLPAVSNSFVISDYQEVSNGIDFAHALQTHPTLFIQSSNASPVTQYLGISAHGTQTELFKALTAAAATSVVQVPVAAGAGTGGVVYYTVFASDATDHQTRTGFVRFTAVNKAGTETCGMSNNAGTADASITELEDGNAAALSVGTLTYAITCVTTPANAVDFQINAVSSLTETVLRAYYTVTITGPGAPLLQ